ncbi:hypothetical protein FB446DRAFT_792979 [Lentinula raphanica]|nr:hypothetical protein FB446DRAFT_792979 [Lentinula raphanica]KAJ3822947.1 hypothetical protein F5880DRAFT_1613308 [Lentinula raphanica]
MSETPEILQTPAMVCGEDELYASESDEFYLLETEPERDLRRSFSLTTLARSMTPRFMATSTFIEEILERKHNGLGSDVLQSNHEDSPLLFAVSPVVCSAPRAYTSTSSWSKPTPSYSSSPSTDPDKESSSDGEKFVTASRSSDYITARTPSIEASFKSLPSIPPE